MVHPIRSSAPLTYLAHAGATLALGLPLIGSHLAQMALHVTDTVMLGWYGVNELAAVVLAASAFFVIFILGSGFAQAVMPMVAAALGEGDDVQVRRDTRMGLWLSIGFGLMVYPLFWWSEQVMLALGQKPEVAVLVQDFLRIAGLGMIPGLLVMVLKSYLAAMERTQVVLWTTIVAVGVNIVLAYPLIFGLWGAPELGIRGAAIASLAVQIVTFGILAGYAAWLPELRIFNLFKRFWWPDWQAFARVFRMGWPIGVTGLLESSMFQATALMMGGIGTVELAAHGIAMEVVALSFMVHLGLSNAATVRTGRALGRRDIAGLRDGAKVAIVLSVAFGLTMVALFLTVPEPIISLFLDRANPASHAIVVFGAQLLAMAAFFQMADAMQAMALGLLRGIKDTRVPMIAAGLSYWVIGIPSAYVLAFWFGMGGIGLWLGLVVGLTVAALSMMWRFWHLAPRG